jgi:hypothetical protein
MSDAVFVLVQGGQTKILILGARHLKEPRRRIKPVLERWLPAQLMKQHQAGQFLCADFQDPVMAIFRGQSIQFPGVKDFQEMQVLFLHSRRSLETLLREVEVHAAVAV